MELPKLNEGGVRKLKDRLDKDLAAVVTSKTANDALKEIIGDLIKSLKKKLEATIIRMGNRRDAGTAEISAWVVTMAPEFRELTQDLKVALGLAPTDMGACRYQGGGCIVTTRTQCDDLGGAFDPGFDCNGSPLP
jgi:hypothetical protein